MPTSRNGWKTRKTPTVTAETGITVDTTTSAGQQDDRTLTVYVRNPLRRTTVPYKLLVLAIGCLAVAFESLVGSGPVVATAVLTVAGTIAA